VDDVDPDIIRLERMPMPIPWLVVLQSVPWTDVIRNAPKVAEGAKKLWGSVAGQAAGPVTTPPVPAVVPAGVDPRGLAALEARLATLDTAVAELHGQMLASSELIKALAEQNTQLVVRVEANRVRTLRLVWALGIVAALVAAGLAWGLRSGA
jgi:hypothetical protein